MLKYGDYPPDFSIGDCCFAIIERYFQILLRLSWMILQSCCAVKAEADSTCITNPAHDPDRMDRAEALVWSLGDSAVILRDHLQEQADLFS